MSFLRHYLLDEHGMMSLLTAYGGGGCTVCWHRLLHTLLPALVLAYAEPNRLGLSFACVASPLDACGRLAAPAEVVVTHFGGGVLALRVTYFTLD